ncbi:response regulator [Streptomyces sp. NPDC060184]|uniref:response regulator n=1 Tax=Streptomyces sp. NPDC060184 TaxID=3347064 RepID=UPI00365F2DCB
MSARVVVADDQSAVREGIVMLLGLLGVDVVGAARDGEEAVALVAEHAPDVVLMDLRMPRCDGVEATRRVRTEYPGTHVVVLTTFDDDESLFAALRAGARGFLTKDAGGEEIVQAISAVLSGDAGLSPAVQRRLLERVAGEPDVPPHASSRDRSPSPNPGLGPNPSLGWSRSRSRSRSLGPGHGPGQRQRQGQGPGLPDGLTPREAEVLVLIAEGLSNAEISRRLHVSQATVKTHINNLFAKTDVRDRAQAVRYAYVQGLARAPGTDVT